MKKEAQTNAGAQANAGTVTTDCFDRSFAAVLNATHPDGEKRELLSSLGLAPTILSAVALGIALKAAGGDVSAAKFLRDTCCEDRAGAEDLDLTPYTDEELRAILNTLEEETP